MRVARVERTRNTASSPSIDPPSGGPAGAASAAIGPSTDPPGGGEPARGHPASAIAKSVAAQVPAGARAGGMRGAPASDVLAANRRQLSGIPGPRDAARACASGATLRIATRALAAATLVAAGVAGVA